MKKQNTLNNEDDASKKKVKKDEWSDFLMDNAIEYSSHIENWEKCLGMIKDSKALTKTNGKTPIMSIKNLIINQINYFEKEFELLSEERKEKNKEKKEVLVVVLKDVCIAIDDFYIEHENKFIKGVFKDGANPFYENFTLHRYYINLIN